VLSYRVIPDVLAELAAFAARAPLRVLRLRGICC
jgi:hypothetical protein